MATSHFNRGRVRASYFDINISAGRLEDVARSADDLSPIMRLALKEEAQALRARAASLLQLLTKPEQAEFNEAEATE